MKVPKGRKAASPPDIGLVKRLLGENARLYAPRYALAFLMMGIVAAMTGASAYIIKNIINDVFFERDSRMIWIIAGAVLVIYVVKGLADYVQNVVMNGIGNSIIASYQKRMFHHLLGQGMDFFNQTSVGDVVTRMSNNAQAARRVLDLVVTSLGKDILSLVALITVMVIQDPILSVVSLIILPLAVLGIASVVRRVRALGRQEFESMAAIVTALKEAVLGIRVVKSFGMEERLEVEMDRAVDLNRRRALKIANLSARTSPVMETLGGIAVAVIVIYGGYGVVHLGRDPGSLFSFLAALLLAYEPAKRLARVNVQLASGLVGVSMIYEFLDRPSGMAEKPNAPDLTIEAGQVELRDIVFHYPNSPAIEDLSVVFPAGKISALVGPSGAGKSTIFALIERFYDPQQGSVLIDGQDIREVSLKSLRSGIALVTQDAFLFEGSVRENIMAGRPGASEDEMITAAKAANAHDFVSAFPTGYDREVGEGGTELSGGQRQRIAIARAMLRDAPILLLDEPTSALDAESEGKVRDALDHLIRGRTTIVIAHRLSTVRNAAIIHVLEAGRLVESGTHQQLAARDGTYARLLALQFAEPSKRSVKQKQTAIAN